MTRTRATTGRTSTCVRSLGKGTKLAREQAIKDRTDQGVQRGKGADEWTSGTRHDGGKKGGKKWVEGKQT